jgi:putative protease
MTDAELQRCTQTLNEIDVGLFSAVRVQCVGAMQYIKEQHPSTKIHYIAETANCNLPTLQLWCSRLGKSLERIVLSIQLPSEKIQEYLQALPVECEILAAGRILLFYSRRNLLLKDFAELGDDWREVLAESDQSGDRPFPVIDNSHGTFMYLDKDQFILHKLEDLAGRIPHYLRLDLRHLSDFPDSSWEIEKIVRLADTDPEDLRRSWPRPTIAPFFRSNLTTKQFKRLNSELRYSRDEHCLAEIVGTERGSHCVYRALQRFALPVSVNIIDPSGAVIEAEITKATDLGGTPQKSTVCDQILIGDWVKKVSVGALVVRREESTAT